MIDIHAHIIPAVDDGSTSMESTIGMLCDAVGQGADTFFATPHSEAFLTLGKEVERRFDNMKLRLGRLFSTVEVYLGCEVLCNTENMEEVTEALRTGRIPTMNRTEYVLVEFSKETDWETVRFCVTKLRQQNLIPIIAHLERYDALQNRMDAVNWLREQGCGIQLNVYSLESTRPEAGRDWARRLILEEKVDFLGTDMHGIGVRMPSISQGMLWLEENCEDAYLDAIVWENAREKLLKQGR